MATRSRANKRVRVRAFEQKSTTVLDGVANLSAASVNTRSPNRMRGKETYAEDASSAEYSSSQAEANMPMDCSVELLDWLSPLPIRGQPLCMHEDTEGRNLTGRREN